MGISASKMELSSAQIETLSKLGIHSYRHGYDSSSGLEESTGGVLLDKLFDDRYVS